MPLTDEQVEARRIQVAAERQKRREAEAPKPGSVTLVDGPPPVRILVDQTTSFAGEITILDKAVLLFLYCTPEPPINLDEPQVQKMVKRLELAHLITWDGVKLNTTEKAKVLCEVIRELPLPVASWTMPK